MSFYLIFQQIINGFFSILEIFDLEYYYACLCTVKWFDFIKPVFNIKKLIFLKNKSNRINKLMKITIFYAYKNKTLKKMFPSEHITYVKVH